MTEGRTWDFATLRTWEGERSRAFEELSFQLLKGRAPKGTRAVRTGNPDGGVEWFAQLPDGTEEGWQAKDVNGIDALLTAMTASVKTVCEERPNLRKLTFVISWNLATGTKKGKQLSQRQRFENQLNSWHKNISGADRVEFDLVQGSDLLEELAKDEHRGRRWFWWNETVFSAGWLEHRHAEQAEAAVDKYRPDLQVDLPIQDDLLALGFDESILSRFDEHRRSLCSAIADLQIAPVAEDDEAGMALSRNLIQSAAAIRSEFGHLMLAPATADDAIGRLQVLLDVCDAALAAVADAESTHRMEHRDASTGGSGYSGAPRQLFRGFGRQGVSSALGDLRSWLDSAEGHALRRPTYFLSGQAGSGKTHLFLDATGRAIAAGRPAVFLAGARFGHGNLWESIADQLGLGHVGADVLLQAMETAGEAASLSGSRFVIFIDALNETAPATFWRDHLPALRAAVQRYPHVALAVSCRDTYKELVLDESEEAQHLARIHPGFAEREVEAAHRYFEHYGLEAPRLPLLLPEFTVPLFLRLYCEAMSGPTGNPAPPGHLGRIALFKRYLDRKVERVARRLPAVASGYALQAARRRVQAVLDGLLDALAQQGQESMPALDAEEIARTVLGGDADAAVTVVGLLQEEGVLTRELLFLGDGKIGEGVRVVFQAFSDFLLVKRRLAQSDDPINDLGVKDWLLHECSLGVQEAAVLYIPEAYGLELPDLLELDLAGISGYISSPGPWPVAIEASLSHALVRSLPHRAPESINDRTRELVRHAAVYISLEEELEVLFTTAPLIDHPYNAYRLHASLADIAMPERDSSFGIATYHFLFEESGPAARLARWAAAGPYPAYDPRVIEAACIPLCWLLSSPNRFMRDWVTKALVTLLRGHLDVMLALVERFWTVDDPYVVQRVIAIAYGALLRSDEEHAVQGVELAAAIQRLVFTPPVRADELLLDAARGILRCAVNQGLMSASDAAAAHSPYGLAPPGPAPSKEELQERYPSGGGVPSNESHSLIKSSLMELGDFGRYVVESGVEHFSHTRIEEARPTTDSEKPQLDAAKWEEALATLTAEQRALLESPLDGDTDLLDAWSLAGGEGEPFTLEQLQMLSECWVRPRRVLDRYPEDEARRWVFERTMQLGWSPDLFGEEDLSISRRDLGRSGHKAERWGKKYQWIAYHELLARIADNFQVADRYDDHHEYQGLHDLIGDREIDPSLPPAAFVDIIERDGTNSDIWMPPPVCFTPWPPKPVPFARYESDTAQFFADHASEPTVEASLFLTDSKGVRWVVLDGSFRQADSAADKRWRSSIQQVCAINTLLVPVGEANTLWDTMIRTTERSLNFLLGLFDTTGHVDCCYLAEIGVSGPSCYWRRDSPMPRLLDTETIHVTSAAEQYRWEGSLLDCSINESVSLSLPSTLVRRALRLRFDPQGPSWVDPSGAPALVYHRRQGAEAHALMMRSDLLSSMLSELNLELIAKHWWQRHQASAGFDSSRASVESTTVVRVDARLRTEEQVLNRREFGLS